MTRAHTLLLIGAAAIGTHAPLAAQMDTGGRVEGGEELEAKVGAGQDGQDQKSGDGGERATGLTIHSENFALVRDRIFIEIGEGGGNFSYDGATASLEPTSVILLPEGEGDISILEQSYRNDTLSTPYLLSLFEGKAIEFMHQGEDGERTIFGGRVVSSGYEGGQVAREPIIQVNGKMRFGLPGTPLFPHLGDDTLLKPRLEWTLGSERGYRGEATVSYLSGGMGWEASYNLVMPEGGGDSRLTGAVSVRNHTGRDFHKAEVKLLAGEVRREAARGIHAAHPMAAEAVGGGVDEKGVEHRSFDEYHVYSLPGDVRLRDRETKQVEFLSSGKVKVSTAYKLSIPAGAGMDTGEGTEGKAQVVRRFSNTEEGGLGVPLPAGTVRVYRLDGGRPEFLGEQRIDHTPKSGEVEIATGVAFDITAKKSRTARRDLGQDYLGNRTVTEGYLIKISNRKKEGVTINVSEQMPGGVNWSIPSESHPHRRAGAGEARWDVAVPADGEVNLEYEVEYSYPR